MTASIVPFQFESEQVRVVEIDGEPMFVAKDVAAVLGYANTRQAVTDHCDDAKPLKDIGVAIHDPQKNQALSELDPQTKLIPEPDVYSLVFGSKLESAKRFKRWVVEEVLPSIRKTGSYSAQPAAPIPRIELYEREAAVCERFYDLSERCIDPILRVMLLDRAKNTLSSDSQAALPNPDGAPFQTYQILEGLGYSSKEIRKLAPSAGKRLKAAYRNLAGREPEQIDRIVDGAARPVNVFPESFREDAQAVLAEWLAA